MDPSNSTISRIPLSLLQLTIILPKLKKHLARKSFGSKEKVQNEVKIHLREKKSYNKIRSNYRDWRDRCIINLLGTYVDEESNTSPLEVTRF